MIRPPKNSLTNHQQYQTLSSSAPIHDSVHCKMPRYGPSMPPVPPAQDLNQRPHHVQYPLRGVNFQDYNSGLNNIAAVPFNNNHATPYSNDGFFGGNNNNTSNADFEGNRYNPTPALNYLPPDIPAGIAHGSNSYNHAYTAPRHNSHGVW